jgi:hypothetical protein
MAASNTVIALYRPKPGQDAALRALLRDHVAELRKIGLAAATPPVWLRAADGTWLEIFDWKSPAAVETAHHHPRVKELWGAFERVCDYVALGDLAEAKQPFAHFERVTELR